MRKVARSFFPEEGVVRDMDIRAENVGVLAADIGSAEPAASQCGTSLPGWQQGTPTTASSALARARRHVLHCGTAVSCEVLGVAWFAENVVCTEFVDEEEILNHLKTLDYDNADVAKAYTLLPCN